MNCVNCTLGMHMFISAVRILLLLAFNYFSVVTVWPCLALIVSHFLPHWPFAEWIPKARFHRGRDPDSVQHCIMGALRPLGTLQREHVHCDIEGLSDLRTQTHELSRTLVGTHHMHTHTHIYTLLYSSALTLLSCAQPHVWAAYTFMAGASSAMGRLRGAAS